MADNLATQAVTEGRLTGSPAAYKYTSPTGETYRITPAEGQSIDDAVREIEAKLEVRSMTGKSALRGFGEGARTGAATILGAPGDIASMLQADPTGAREAVTGQPGQFTPSKFGSAAVGEKIGAKPISALPPGERPTARAGQVLAETLPFIGAPYGRLGTKATQQFAKEAPKRYVTAETTAASGAAVGAAGAEYLAPGNVSVRMGAEIAGGLTSPFSIAVGNIHKIGNAARRKAVPFTKAGRRAKAAEITQETLQTLGESPEAVARELEQVTAIPGETFTSAQKAGSRGLTVLERKFSKESAQFGLQVEKRTQQSIQAINENWRRAIGAGDVADLSALARERQNYWGELIDGRIARAEEIGQQLGTAFPGVDRPATNIRARNLIVQARTDARASERALWGRVPRDVPTGMDNIETGWQQAFEDLLPGETPTAQAPVLNRIDEYLRRLEGPDAPPVAEITPTSGELLRIRNRLNRRIRTASSGPNPDNDAVRRLHILNNAVMDELAEADVTAADARAFSREFHQRFTQTEAGDVLKRRPTGAQAVSPEATLERSVAGAGPEAPVRARQLREAMQPIADMPGTTRGAEMEQAQREIVSDMLRTKVLNENGSINPSALRKFRTDPHRSAMLDELGMSPILADTEQAARVIADRLGVHGRRKKVVGETAAFVQAARVENPATVFSTALSGDNPYKELRGLFTMARKTPQARNGARHALFNSWFDNAIDNQTGMISGTKMRQSMDQELILPSGKRTTVIEYAQQQGIVSADQAKRLNHVAERATRIEQAMASGRSLDEIISEPDPLYDLMVRWAGAQIGGASALGRASGTSLVMAGYTSRAARKMLEKIPNAKVSSVIQEAVNEPAMMARLLRAPTSVRAQQRYWERFHAYLYQVGILDEEDRQQVAREGREALR